MLRLIEKTCLFVLSFVSRDPKGNRHTDVHWPSHYNGYCQGYEDALDEGQQLERDRWHKMLSA